MDRIEKIVWVQGLFIECPFGKPLANCPANQYRELPLVERVKIPKSMSDQELDKIIEHHLACLKFREST